MNEKVIISEVSGLGDGAAVNQAGKKIYVPHTLTGEEVEIDGQGRLLKVLKPSESRIAAVCEHFGSCGGCSLQHMDATSYSAFKQDRLLDALHHSGYEHVVPEPLVLLPAATRRRAELKCHWSGDVLELGFFESHSHRVVLLNQCHVLHPALFTLTKKLQASLPHVAECHQISAIMVSLADKGIEIVLEHKTPFGIAALEGFGKLAAELNITRIASSQSGTLLERGNVVLVLGGVHVKLPPASFMQASKEGEEAITAEVMLGMQGAKRTVDLFCGVGTYTFPLLKSGASVLAVEYADSMVRALADSARAGGVAAKLKTMARDLDKRPLTPAELKGMDGVVINPPRTGAFNQCKQIAASSVKNVVMVSCNPATFGRDAKVLNDAGFQLERVRGIDQFTYTPHLEIVAHFTR